MEIPENLKFFICVVIAFIVVVAVIYIAGLISREKRKNYS